MKQCEHSPYSSGMKFNAGVARLFYSLIACLLFSCLSDPSYSSGIDRSIQPEIDRAFPERRFDGKGPAVLLIHGYGGSPLDMKPLADELRKQGITYNAITLPGHGTAPRDLENITMSQWLETSIQEYDAMKKRYGDVSIVGFSMGGALALHIAAERDVSRLVVLSPYFRVEEKWYYFDSAEDWALRMSKFIDFVKKVKIGQINDPKGIETYNAYEYLPLKTTVELARLGEHVTEQAAQVTSPILWIHSEDDIVADYEMSKDIFETVPTENKELVTYYKSNHIILYDYDSREAIKEILSFLGIPGTDAKR